MKPLVLTELETHLVTEHKVTVELVGALAERLPSKRDEVAANSHALMHMSGLTENAVPHTHPEFEMPEGFESNMGLREITDEELVENKRQFIEAFGQERWDASMDALAQTPDSEFPLPSPEGETVLRRKLRLAEEDDE